MNPQADPEIHTSSSRSISSNFSFYDYITDQNESDRFADRSMSFKQFVPGYQTANNMDRVGVNRKRPAATYHNRCDETSKRQQKQKARADSVDVDSLFCSEDEDDRQSPSVRAEDAPDNDLMQILQESTRGHPPQPRAPSRQQVQSRQPQSAIPPAAQQVRQLSCHR